MRNDIHTKTSRRDKDQKKEIRQEASGGFKEIDLINCCKRGAVVKRLHKRTEKPAGKNQVQMLREKFQNYEVHDDFMN